MKWVIIISAIAIAFLSIAPLGPPHFK